MHEVLNKLEGGDRRSIGRSNEVVADFLRDPSLFEIVFNGMLSDDSLGAIEKITEKHPDYLQPYKNNSSDLYSAYHRVDVKVLRRGGRMETHNQSVPQGQSFEITLPAHPIESVSSLGGISLTILCVILSSSS